MVKKILACLALAIFVLGCVSALELDYKQAPARQEKIQIWNEGNGYYLFDLGGIFSLQKTEFDTATIFLQALANFENDHPDLEIISREPFITDGGDCNYYYIKCVPKA